jgi:hypothetical protein
MQTVVDDLCPGTRGQPEGPLCAAARADVAAGREPPAGAAPAAALGDLHGALCTWTARVPLRTEVFMGMPAAFEYCCAGFAANRFPTPSLDEHAFNHFAFAPALSPTACKSGCIHEAMDWARSCTIHTGAHARLTAARCGRRTRRSRFARPRRALSRRCWAACATSASRPQARARPAHTRVGVLLSQFAGACGCDGHWWSAGSSTRQLHHGASAGVGWSAHAALMAVPAS